MQILTIIVFKTSYKPHNLIFKLNLKGFSIKFSDYLFLVKKI